MPNPAQDMKARTSLPAGYIGAPATHVFTPEPITHTMPTPPSVGYTPHPTWKGGLPGLLTDPDAQRQVYSRGVRVQRFWPTSNGS